MASEIEKWKQGDAPFGLKNVYSERHSFRFVCTAANPEHAAEIVREHNERGQMVEALKLAENEISDPNRDHWKARDYLLARNLFYQLLALATPQRGKDGE